MHTMTSYPILKIFYMCFFVCAQQHHVGSKCHCFSFTEVIMKSIQSLIVFWVCIVLPVCFKNCFILRHTYLFILVIKELKMPKHFLQSQIRQFSDMITLFFCKFSYTHVCESYRSQLLSVQSFMCMDAYQYDSSHTQTVGCVVCIFLGFVLQD